MGKKEGLGRAMVLSLIMIGSVLVPLSIVPGEALACTAHAPIIIFGNAAFTSANGVVSGIGTASDPYVIAGWEISSAVNGILISNAKAHFVVSNCHVHGCSETGIGIYDCPNADVDNNICSYNRYGLVVCDSVNTSMVSNNCSFNSWGGISLSPGDHNVIKDNSVWSNGGRGVYISSMNNGTIVGNDVCANAYEGILIDESYDNTVVANNFSGTPWGPGFLLEYSSRNLVVGNTITSNYESARVYHCDNNTFDDNDFSLNNQGIGAYYTNYTVFKNNDLSYHENGAGLIIYGSNNEVTNNLINSNGCGGVFCSGMNDDDQNRIWNNTICDNRIAIQSGDGEIMKYTGYPQGHDWSKTSNHWNSSSGYGNYWSDWQTPDDVAPWDIVDLPYQLLGSSSAKDFFPLTHRPNSTYLSVIITDPTSSPTMSADRNLISLGGWVSGSSKIVSLNWTNSLGGSGIACMTPSHRGLMWQSCVSVELFAGKNTITVTAHDENGKCSADTLAVTYYADAAPPTLVITAPTSGSTYSTRSSTVTLSGTASDNAGVTGVTWSNDGGGSGTATGTTSWSVSGVALKEGDNTITVTASDAAGNMGTDTIVVHYDHDVTMTCALDIDPDTLDTKSEGVWITAYIELPSGSDPADVNVTSIRLYGLLTVESPASVGDYDSDGISDLMVKFDRGDFIALLNVSLGCRSDVTVTLVGELSDGSEFSGSDAITAMNLPTSQLIWSEEDGWTPAPDAVASTEGSKSDLAATLSLPIIVIGLLAILFLFHRKRKGKSEDKESEEDLPSPPVRSHSTGNIRYRRLKAPN